KYFYVDTRGHVWNRSHCLNIGIRLSETEYTMTSDVDVIYAPNFIESILKILSPNHVIYCHPTWLPKDASAPDGNAHGARLDRSKDHKGMCQVVSTKMLHDVCGFDEYYCYWGFEDEDLALRLNRKGVKEFWLNENEETFLFHQWHDESGYRGDGFPAGIY